MELMAQIPWGIFCVAMLGRTDYYAVMSELKKIREELGLRQAEFAQHLGITQSALSKMERGDRTVSKPYLLGVRKIAEDLAVTLKDAAAA